eukprot:TRINITY_DN55387_c0_g1_i1.p2 TRINITY_DN55387_c0_g1~~TRINITY_DN55387_c0_g1_i1.p2  ORF type:complete len:134 (+),score=47.98 TRINITY_DN55387_c0_g1_i1:92-493(+)
MAAESADGGLVGSDQPTAYMSEWEQQSRDALAARDREMESQHAREKERAREALAAMGAQRRERIEDRKRRNRDSESAAESERRALEAQGEGTRWERVVRLVDLQGDERRLRQTARMRQVFASLRETERSASPA